MRSFSYSVAVEETFLKQNPVDPAFKMKCIAILFCLACVVAINANPVRVPSIRGPNFEPSYNETEKDSNPWFVWSSPVPSYSNHEIEEPELTDFFPNDDPNSVPQSSENPTATSNSENRSSTTWLNSEDGNPTATLNSADGNSATSLNTENENSKTIVENAKFAGTLVKILSTTGQNVANAFADLRSSVAATTGRVLDIVTIL